MLRGREPPLTNDPHTARCEVWQLLACPSPRFAARGAIDTEIARCCAYLARHGGRIAISSGPSFSVIAKGAAWFWCSLSLMKNDELIGPFPSEEEAKKDAKATLGIEDGEI
jgi:hypothetical protein